MSAIESGDFWRWSLAHYAKPRVAESALFLQDKFQFNVNIILWACWAGEQFDTAPELVIRKAIDMTKEWNLNVTQKLRDVRRYLKKNAAAAQNTFRERVKQDELDSEQVEQTLLETLSLSQLSPAADTSREARETRMRRNLAGYAALIGAGKNPEFSISLLQTLIDHILGDEPEAVANEG